MESELEIANGDATYDLSSILSSPNRDYLVRNNGDQVKFDSFKGKVTGLYFSASWCGPCQRFTPKLVEAYNELAQSNNFEIVFISGDEDDESFDAYFSKMPWLAIPFSDSDTREKLNELFGVSGIPHLVILNEDGKILTSEGVQVIVENGSDGYPFTSEQIEKLRKQEEEAKMNQSLKSLLVTESRDYVITSDGKKVPVAELEGKTVGLYFVLASYYGCLDFNSKLIEVYNSLREGGESFEIVMVPLDEDEESFGEEFEKLPWLSLPINDKCCLKLVRYFELGALPTVVIIGPNGKTLQSNVVEAIEEHGMKAYPFTPEKFIELEEIEKAKREAQTLESLLVNQDSDYVIGEAGVKVPVSDLNGKDILLYFSAHWCRPCRAFLPTLTKAYEEINKNNKRLEVIFISSDRDQKAFEDYFSEMPWLALPFGDKRKESLSSWFKVDGIPTLVALGPTGKTVSTDARGLIMAHGAEAYPFTRERIEEIEKAFEKILAGWAPNLKCGAHGHELFLTKRKNFVCDGCSEDGSVWSYYCEKCDFDLHPKCAFDEESKDKTAAQEWVCDGDKCYKE
ncbi:hypothetical protein ABFS82_05G016100 [Erythranthe guttata]|uniref:protein-disulfide reductase n=1 Tax=Erythranthe guttata TaxID=4155 RepID=A0A022Q5L4_ERYGU|nr:PREDICTED: probable nucleoredoxin 1 isoform X1 [Erythranthe guttata]EYU22493.1 hypothetical protein MIMGU_mgv1a003730mg [Erythranthe guttata]|eukprot:XP_012855292.1 PREDICTED: probable nucleoredoxin 1 isoform X1 [Erythranthe guttata]